MRRAAEYICGGHDFSAFRSSECQARSPVRELRRVSIERHDDHLVFEFAANAFLHHMIRNLVGSLVYVGKGKHEPEWLAQVLASRDRSRAAPTFEAAGLYLASITYDIGWGVPATPAAHSVEILGT